MSTSFFGLQVALDLAAGHPLRTRLADLVHALRDTPTITAQRPHLARLADVLSQAIRGHGVLGTWDLIREDAEGQYEEWASGLEAMAGWPDDDFGHDGQLLLASQILLVGRGSNADRTLGDACDLPERDWHRRRTYADLARLPPTLNLTNVVGCAFYLAPHPERRPGFSRAVLTGDGFEYLTRIAD